MNNKLERDMQDLEHVFCRLNWADTRMYELAGKKLPRLKALSNDDGTYNLYENSVFAWAGPACCAWDARTKAYEKRGTDE